ARTAAQAPWSQFTRMVDSLIAIQAAKAPTPFRTGSPAVAAGVGEQGTGQTDVLHELDLLRVALRRVVRLPERVPGQCGRDQGGDQTHGSRTGQDADGKSGAAGDHRGTVRANHQVGAGQAELLCRLDPTA